MRTARDPHVAIIVPQRCTYCERLVWPWQRMGWRVHPYWVTYWHPACRELYVRLGGL